MNLKSINLVQSDCALVLANRTDSLNKLKGSTVAITGGTGFVGIWLTELIQHLNDNHSFGTQIISISRNTDVFKHKYPHISKRKDISFQSTDVRHLVDLPKATDWVVHAAASPDGRYHSSNPLGTMQTIGEGTASILRTIERCSNFKMLLNISSGLIYGQQPSNVSSISETFGGAPTTGTASSAYADAKRYAETLCAASRSQSRTPTLSIRPFTFIGPYQSLDSPWALNNFIRDAFSGNSIRVLGDGQTLRSYLYASDMAFWILRILTGGNQGDVYNVGSDTPISLGKLAEKIAINFSPSPAVVLRTGPANQSSKSDFIPDISKAKMKFDLDVTVNLDDAIKRTIDWNTAVKN